MTASSFPFPANDSGSDSIVLGLPDRGILIDRWDHYSFNSDFLSPTDSWSFTTAGKNIDSRIIDSLYCGARVTLSINGKTQGGGFITSVDWKNAPGGGLVYNIQGKDAFGPFADAGADSERYQYTPEQTLDDVVRDLFSEFGYSDPSQFVISNDANRTVMTGVRTLSKKGKALKAYRIGQQLRPHVGEGCWSFLTRFLHRFGLWAWPSADQRQVIVSTPRFDTQPIQALVRKVDGSGSNILSGGVREDTDDQPSAILCYGTSAGGPAAQSKLKVIVVNELTGLLVERGPMGGAELIPIGNVLGLINRHPDAKFLDPRGVFQGYLGTLAREDPVSRPMFLQDDEARTPEQLLRFAYRELSLRQQRMWTAAYEVEGHTQGGVPWAVDTIVRVDDDEGKGFHSPMWVKSRTFEKGVHGGTTTRLELILPYTLDFGAEVSLSPGDS